MSTTTVNKNYTKNFCQPIQKQRSERIRKEKKNSNKKGNCTAFSAIRKRKKVSFCLLLPTFCSFLVARWFFTGRNRCLTIPTVQEFNSAQEFTNPNLGGGRSFYPL